MHVHCTSCGDTIVATVKRDEDGVPVLILECGHVKEV